MKATKEQRKAARKRQPAPSQNGQLPKRYRMRYVNVVPEIEPVNDEGKAMPRVYTQPIPMSESEFDTPVLKFLAEKGIKPTDP